MDSTDVVDEVNALLKLDVGDSYRLEHIKQTFIQNKSIWITDQNYLKRMREKYLIKHAADDDEVEDLVFEDKPEVTETIHCWKCGKKGPLGANFCMICGASLFEVGGEPQPIPESKSKNPATRKSKPSKIIILVGIPVLILIILGAGYTQGYFDSILERVPDSDTVSAPIAGTVDVMSNDPNSKCGPGTIFDSDTNSCVLGSTKTGNTGEPNSKCGPGTIFDSESNSCILG